MSERWLSDNLLENITATVITPTWNDSISMAHELRERRALDLSDEDREALKLGVSMLRESTRGAIQSAAYVKRSCAAIDKLLKGAK